MYLLDANIFIQAKNFHYGFDICPGFWDWMDMTAPGPLVKSIAKVYDELAEGNDGLATWIKPRKDDGRFLEITDVDTQRLFGSVAAMVQAGPYRGPAKADFLAKADPWLVAKAKVLNATVVTHEKSAPEAVKKIHLPDICSEFEVSCIDTYDLLRTHAVSFRL